MRAVIWGVICGKPGSGDVASRFAVCGGCAWDVAYIDYSILDYNDVKWEMGNCAGMAAANSRSMG